MLERVVLHGDPPRARVLSESFVGDLPVFVGRGADGGLDEDGVLLREGRDEAVVRAAGATRELPLYQERADGTQVRVRVARIHARRSR